MKEFELYNTSTEQVMDIQKISPELVQSLNEELRNDKSPCRWIPHRESVPNCSCGAEFK
jgi:hypothetical protein